MWHYMCLDEHFKPTAWRYSARSASTGSRRAARRPVSVRLPDYREVSGESAIESNFKFLKRAKSRSSVSNRLQPCSLHKAAI